jgi:hypothetical protein
MSPAASVVDRTPYRRQSSFANHQQHQQSHNDFGDEQEEDDFMKRIYESTVDGTCHSVSACQSSIEDQLDLFTVSVFVFVSTGYIF